MKGEEEKIDQLVERLEKLVRYQGAIQNEINSLKTEIYQLKDASKRQEKRETESEQVTIEKPAASLDESVKEPVQSRKTAFGSITKQNFEKFIGENLINKIGIVITVIGVVIGAKFAIDNQWLNPLTRIILGYLAGIALLFFAIRLKEKYAKYSAVLLSGSMAIFYFITFSAYAFYELIPQILAFVLMVAFTVFTVLSALRYRQQVIAVIGMVGAYGVPFLLSKDSGQVEILFSYMAIINAGILFIAVKQYWKILYYSSFGITWLIYLSWYWNEYLPDDQFTLSLVFGVIFFMIFYLTFLGYKLVRSEKFNRGDIVMLLLNSFVFYAIGYSILEGHQSGGDYLGLFTLINATVHFTVAAIIKKRKTTDRNLFYFVAGLVLIFITIAIPVQLDGNWVTLLWAGEAALMFWIGRTKKISVYEQLSYPLMILAFFSQLHDWMFLHSFNGYDENYHFIPVFNIEFLSAFLFIAAFLIINYLNQKHARQEVNIKKWMASVMNVVVPGILLVSLFFIFRNEIYYFWKQKLNDSAIEVGGEYGYEMRYNYLLNKMKEVWLLNYNLIFLTILSFVNLQRIKNRQLAIINMVLNGIAIFLFLSGGLLEISNLREAYLSNELTEFYPRSFMYIMIRYISLILLAGMVYTCFKYYQAYFTSYSNRTKYGIGLHVIILWVASSELLHWMDMFNVESDYKLGLSILWGIYALLMVILGIWKRRKYLRVSAIVLFGATLLKLFFYDISHLNLISKAIVFVSLGALLLTISYLYNRYKHAIFEDEQIS